MEPPPPSTPTSAPMTRPMPTARAVIGLPVRWRRASAAAEEGAQPAPGPLGAGVTRASPVAGDAGHDLVDVLAAPGPGGLAAGAAGGRSAHGGSPRDRWVGSGSG